MTPDWQVSHNENQGRTFVIVDMSQDPDDANALLIRVSGRASEQFAAKLAGLLQDEMVSSDQA